MEPGFEGLHSLSGHIISRGRKPGTSEIEVVIEQTAEDVNQQLRMGPKETAITINRLRTIDNQILSWSKDCLPSKYFSETPDPINTYDNITVCDIDQLEKRIDPKKDDIAIIALPPQKVQDVIYRLEKIGIKGVFYFASRAVKTQGNMVVINQDISINLGILTYKIMEKNR